MTNVNNEYLLNEIKKAGFEARLRSVSEPYGLLTIVLERTEILNLAKALFNHEELQMQYLTDLCGIHYPDHPGSELGVIYHLHSLVNNIRLRVKCFMPDGDAHIESLTPLYSGANWMERETYDFFGINFTGHPNLKRILNVDEMDYFPLRKEYPLEDGTRTDKDDRYFGR